MQHSVPHKVLNVKSLAITLGIGLGAFLFNWLFHVVVARHGSAAHYGIFVSAVAFFYILRAVIGLGVDAAITNNAAKLWQQGKQSQLRMLLYVFLIWLLLAGLALIAIALVHGLFLRGHFAFSPDVDAVILVMWASLGGCLVAVSNALLIASARPILATAISSLLSNIFCYLSAVIILQFIEPGKPVWALLCYALGPVLTIPILYKLIKNDFNFFDRVAVDHSFVLSAAKHGFLSRVVQVVLNATGDIYLLMLRILGVAPAFLGAFAAVFNSAHIVREAISGTTGLFLTEIDNATGGNKQALAVRALHKCALVAAFVGLSALVLSLFFGNYVLQLFGHNFEVYKLELSMAVLFTAVAALAKVYFRALCRLTVIKRPLLLSLAGFGVVVSIAAIASLFDSVFAMVSGFGIGVVIFCVAQYTILRKALRDLDKGEDAPTERA